MSVLNQNEEQIEKAMSSTNGSGEHKVFERWWKSFVSILLSLAAVGAIIWALGNRFFVAREEFLEMKWKTGSIENKVNDVQGSVKQIENNIETIKVKITEFASANQRRTR